jgi:geranylgeranyl pyrophosphate synthase
MGPADGETERIARDWLMRAGKRWRPFLTVSAFQALREDSNKPLPDDLRKVALAVECFHKASLIHDDIEDGDAERYGEPTLHSEYGIAVALNVGDLLIGEGYRLLAASSITAEQRAAMFQVASEGQRELCRGQGAELTWARTPRPLSSLEVLDIFRSKTAPAFAVALRLGALYAGVEPYEEVADVLSGYSEALGIAYQIRDDLSDLGEGGETNDIAGLRPSLLLATAHERAEGELKARLASHWRREQAVPFSEIERIYAEVGAADRCRDLLERYKEEAVRTLKDLENPSLKGLLRRVLGKIFNDTEIKGWCKEFEEKNGVVAASRGPAFSDLPVPVA